MYCVLHKREGCSWYMKSSLSLHSFRASKREREGNIRAWHHVCLYEDTLVKGVTWRLGYKIHQLHTPFIMRLKRTWTIFYGKLYAHSWYMLHNIHANLANQWCVLGWMFRRPPSKTVGSCLYRKYVFCIDGTRRFIALFIKRSTDLSHWTKSYLTMFDVWHNNLWY